MIRRATPAAAVAGEHACRMARTARIRASAARGRVRREHAGPVAAAVAVAVAVEARAPPTARAVRMPSECCSGACTSGTCGTGGGSGSGSGSSSSGGGSCSADGQSCSDPSECCSGACTSGTCGSDGSGSSSGGGSCSADGQSCSDPSECCSGACTSGTCGSDGSGSSSAGGVFPDDQSCSDPSQCCGGGCSSGTCNTPDPVESADGSGSDEAGPGTDTYAQGGAGSARTTTQIAPNPSVTCCSGTCSAGTCQAGSTANESVDQGGAVADSGGEAGADGTTDPTMGSSGNEYQPAGVVVGVDSDANLQTSSNSWIADGTNSPS